MIGATTFDEAMLDGDALWWWSVSAYSLDWRYYRRMHGMILYTAAALSMYEPGNCVRSCTHAYAYTPAQAMLHCQLMFACCAAHCT